MPNKIDPLRGFKFRVNLGFGKDLGFRKVSGLSADIGVYEQLEISDPATKVKLPELLSFEDVTLERGAAFDSTLTNWFMEVADCLTKGTSYDFRRTVVIVSYGKGYGELPGWGWKLFKAWPKSLKFADLDAESSSILIESVVLAHEGIMVDASRVMSDTG